MKFNGEIVSRNGANLFVGRLNGKLFEVEFRVEQTLFAELTGEKLLNNVSKSLWHFRLGHLNTHDMKRMVTNNAWSLVWTN